MLIDIKTKPITEILKRVVASGYLKNGFPLSALVVAPVGAGKTVALKKVLGKSILGLSDCTPYGITKLLPEIRAKNIKHIIIFDLVEPMSRNRSTVNSLIGFLNSLIEEGIFKISTGFMTVNEPLKLGLISSTTSTEIRDKRKGWLGIGFISRMIPISFSYTNVDIIQILENLAQEKYKDILPEVLNLREKDIKENEEINQMLIPYAQELDTHDSNKPLPFRRINQLKILLSANALINNRKEVTKEDFEWFKSIANWLNYNCNPL